MKVEGSAETLGFLETLNIIYTINQSNIFYFLTCFHHLVTGPFLKAIPTIIKIYMLGNAQGKYQRHLHVDGNRDYLQAALWDGSPVEITIPPASDGKDLYSSYRSFSSLV